MYISTGNRIRIGVLLITILITGTVLPAQEQGFFAQHRVNGMAYNPAFAGNRDIPGFTFITRNQWMGWEGFPLSSLLTAHTRLKNKNAGAGVSLVYDRMGPVSYTGLAGLYSYTLQISQNSTLVLGLQGEIRLQQLRISQLQLVDQGDPLFGEDPGIKVQPNAGVGAFYKFRDYQVTLSVPRLLNSALSPFEGESSKESRRSRVFYLGGYTHYDIREDIRVEPSILVALSRGSSPFMELAGTLYYQGRFGLGLLYRFNNTIGAMVRYKHKELLDFGYAYDVSTSLIRYNKGTHELFLGYNFPFNRTKTLSPRRF